MNCDSTRNSVQGLQSVILLINDTSLLSFSRKRLFFADFSGNIWATSFMVYAFQGLKILQSGVFKVLVLLNEYKG